MQFYRWFQPRPAVWAALVGLGLAWGSWGGGWAHAQPASAPAQGANAAAASTANPSATAGAASNRPPSLVAVPVDWGKYIGTWYQVALYPNRFQAQCAKDTTATYRSLPGGDIEVVNTCRMANGQLTSVNGTARYRQKPADPSPANTATAPSNTPAAAPTATAPAQLEVRFAPAWLSWLPLVWGDYWVVDIAPDYRWAIVSEPKREYLWVLSRTPALSPTDEQTVQQFLQKNGFDLARLQAHAHSGEK
jgi:apolipoprotein D and lipocalin family protein